MTRRELWDGNSHTLVLTVALPRTLQETCRLLLHSVVHNPRDLLLPKPQARYIDVVLDVLERAAEALHCSADSTQPRREIADPVLALGVEGEHIVEGSRHPGDRFLVLGLTSPGDKLPTKSLFQKFLWVDLNNPNKRGSHGQDACAQHRDLFQELFFPLLPFVNLVGQLGNLEPLVQLGKLLQLVLLQSLIVLGMMGWKSNC